MDHYEKMKLREDSMRKAWREDHPNWEYEVWTTCAATEVQAKYAEAWIIKNLAEGRFEGFD